MGEMHCDTGCGCNPGGGSGCGSGGGGFEQWGKNMLLYALLGFVALYFVMTFAVKNGVLSAVSELESKSR